MSRYRLRTYDSNPPGGYPFVEVYKGVTKKYHAQPMPEPQAEAIADFRRANGWPRATKKEALEDLGQYTCQRLGGMLTYCIEVNKQDVPIIPLAPSHPIMGGRCAGCGAVLT